MPIRCTGAPRVLVRLDAAVRTPPSEFCIWRFGPVDTTKGKFLFDAKSATSVMREWRDWGNRLTFDYGHDATLGARGEDGKSAGSCNLELRDDGLYATDVRWTDKAARELGAGEWLYFSPTFFTDKKSGRITSLINIALTNIPATKGMAPLVAASQERLMDPKEEALKKLAAAERSYGLILVTLADDGDDGGAEEDTEEMKKAKAVKRADAKNKLAKAKLEYDSALRECAAFGDDDGDPPSSKGGANEPPPPKDKPDTTSRNRRPAPRSSTVTGGSRIEQLAREITGGATEAEVLGKLRALGAIQEEQPNAVEQLERLEQLETAVFTGQARELMKTASDAGRLTPKQKAYALKIGNIDELTAYLDTLPVVATTRQTRKEPDQKVASSMTIESLEDWEIEMCDRMGTSREDYLTQKKANAERRQSSQAPKPVAARKSV